MSQADIFAALKLGLEQADSIQSPSEIHGTLTGMLSIDNNQRPSAAVEDAESEALIAALDALSELILDGLFDPNLSFEPLLPDDEQPLDVRVESLARWCSGYLFGLSYLGCFSPDKLSAEVREIISDLTELSRVELTAEEGHTEGGEEDYAELVEYLRVSVQMIFLELQPRREDPLTRETLH